MNHYTKTLQTASKEHFDNPIIMSMVDHIRDLERLFNAQCNALNKAPFEAYQRGLSGKRGYTPLLGYNDRLLYGHQEALETLKKLGIQFDNLQCALSAIGTEIEE